MAPKGQICWQMVHPLQSSVEMDTPFSPTVRAGQAVLLMHTLQLRHLSALTRQCWPLRWAITLLSRARIYEIVDIFS